MSSVSADILQALIERLRLYAQTQRLAILAELLDTPLTVGEIEQRSGIGQPTLSQQLGELRRGGVLRTWRESRQVYYDFADENERTRAFSVLSLLRQEPCKPAPQSPFPPDPVAGGAFFARINRR